MKNEWKISLIQSDRTKSFQVDQGPETLMCELLETLEHESLRPLINLETLGSIILNQNFPVWHQPETLMFEFRLRLASKQLPRK